MSAVGTMFSLALLLLDNTSSRPFQLIASTHSFLHQSHQDNNSFSTEPAFQPNLRSSLFPWHEGSIHRPIYSVPPLQIPRGAQQAHRRG